MPTGRKVPDEVQEYQSTGQAPDDSVQVRVLGGTKAHVDQWNGVRLEQFAGGPSVPQLCGCVYEHDGRARDIAADPSQDPDCEPGALREPCVPNEDACADSVPGVVTVAVGNQNAHIVVNSSAGQALVQVPSVGKGRARREAKKILCDASYDSLSMQSSLSDDRFEVAFHTPCNKQGAVSCDRVVVPEGVCDLELQPETEEFQRPGQGRTNDRSRGAFGKCEQDSSNFLSNSMPSDSRHDNSLAVASLVLGDPQSTRVGFLEPPDIDRDTFVGGEFCEAIVQGIQELLEGTLASLVSEQLSFEEFRSFRKEFHGIVADVRHKFAAADLGEFSEWCPGFQQRVDHLCMRPWS